MLDVVIRTLKSISRVTRIIGLIGQKSIKGNVRFGGLMKDIIMILHLA